MHLRMLEIFSGFDVARAGDKLEMLEYPTEYGRFGNYVGGISSPLKESNLSIQIHASHKIPKCMLCS